MAQWKPYWGEKLYLYSMRSDAEIFCIGYEVYRYTFLNNKNVLNLSDDGLGV